MLSLLSFLLGLLIGFLIGTILTFVYFRTRWSTIRAGIIEGKTVTDALVDSIKQEKGGFIIRNSVAEYIKENPEATLQNVIEE